MSNANKAEKPSAYIEAQNLLTAYIADAERYPFVCKNLAINHIKKSMEVLKNSIGGMELAARRADVHGVAVKQEDCIDRKHGE